MYADACCCVFYLTVLAHGVFQVAQAPRVKVANFLQPQNSAAAAVFDAIYVPTRPKSPGQIARAAFKRGAAADGGKRLQISHYKMVSHTVLLASYFLMAVAGALPATAITVWSAQHERPEFLSAVMSLASLPWCIKCVFGAISDCYPISGLHRCPYIVMHCIGYAMSWFLLGSGGLEKEWAFALCLFMQSYCIVWVDVLLDGCMVQAVHANRNDYGGGKLQSNAWIARSIGSFMASAIGAALLYAMPPKIVFRVTGMLLLPIAAWAYELEGPPRDRSNAPASVYQLMQNAFTAFKTTDSLRYPTVFLTSVALVPSASIALTYFLRNALHYTPASFAVLDCVGDIAHVFGALAFKLLLRDMHVRSSVKKCIFIIVILRLLQLLLVCKVTRSLIIASLDEASMSIASEIVAMPVLAITADNAPAHMEATVYACVLGMANLGATVATLAGGVLADVVGITRDNFEHLWIVIVFTAFLGLWPLKLLRLLPHRIQETNLRDTADTSIAHVFRATCRRKLHAFFACNKALFCTIFGCRVCHIPCKQGKSRVLHASAAHGAGQDACAHPAATAGL